MKHLILSLSVLLLSTSLIAQDLQCVSGISYRPKDKALKEQCVLDILRPENAQNLPVVVWFHSGGLTMGTRTDIPKNLKDTSYIIVSVEYRLLKDSNTLDDCIDDCAASVAWVYRNIRLYALDRMFSAEKTNHTFTMPADFDAESYFSRYVGAMIENKPM